VHALKSQASAVSARREEGSAFIFNADSELLQMNSLLQQMLMLTVKTDWTRSDVKNVWYIAVMKYELYGLFLRLQIS